MNELATDENLNEEAYLALNPDVARAVRAGAFDSARQHFELCGRAEKRRQQLAGERLEAVREQKARKLERIEPLLRRDLPHHRTDDHFDFLTPELKESFNVFDVEAVSSHDYDPDMMRLVERHADGLVLDCGAGSRPVYFENVVNLEIAAYDSTDVLGVGEVLPFVDDTFDAVISIAVLEHVRDPFRCAREIARVMKPGAELYCAVPFLQPLHGYPDHYYNMTHRGLRNLFEGVLVVDDVGVIAQPIWTLTWFLSSWVDGLDGETRERFMDMKVNELVGDGAAYLQEPFVTELCEEKNLELASVCLVRAHKT